MGTLDKVLVDGMQQWADLLLASHWLQDLTCRPRGSWDKVSRLFLVATGVIVPTALQKLMSARAKAAQVITR